VQREDREAWSQTISARSGYPPSLVVIIGADARFHPCATAPADDRLAANPLLARSRAVVALRVQPCLPDGAGMVQTGIAAG
jgi:hypothetical protein